MSESTDRPITEAVVYELDWNSREWLAAPIPADFSPRLRALCELWRGEHPACRFAMLLGLGQGQYSLRYFPDLAALISAIESTNKLAVPFGAIVPLRFEVLSESKAALSALVPPRDAPGAAPSTH